MLDGGYQEGIRRGVTFLLIPGDLGGKWGTSGWRIKEALFGLVFFLSIFKNFILFFALGSSLNQWKGND